MNKNEEKNKKMKNINKDRLIHLGINCILYLFGIVFIKYIKDMQLKIYIPLVFLPIAFLINSIVYYLRIKMFDLIYIIRSVILLLLFLTIRFGKYPFVVLILFFDFIYTLDFLNSFRTKKIEKQKLGFNIKEDERDKTTKLLKDEDKYKDNLNKF